MTEKQAVALDRGWGIVLRDLGIDSENVLRRAELPIDLFAREQAQVGVEEYFRMLYALEAEAQDPELPIRLGMASSPETFHPVVFAALCSPDLTVAAKRIAQYKRLIAPVTLKIEDGPEGFFVGMQWDDPVVRVPPVLGATELVFLTQIARIGTREHICPVRVESAYRMEPVESYGTFFGVTPEPGANHGVTFSAKDARQPFMTASESMWETFEPELRRRLTKIEASSPLAERVRSILLESLPSGEASIDVTARRLGLSARTLQRRLRPEGVSYKELVQRTRAQLAHHYVTKTDLPYIEIGFLLGYEEPSSFFRAFRAWTGETPAAVRGAVAG
ncbi:MAG: AraC family transcriptional regulator ligand-binding domain-containing protein [Acidobacteriota bacterium]